jgi:hypothetical protein
LPNNNDATSPAMYSEEIDTTNHPSTNDSAAASTHIAAGAENGKRRRPSNTSTTHAVAGTANHRHVPGSRPASRPNATSRAPSNAPIAISTSKP